VNLGYTTIKSPIDGRIGKVNITEGNYVQVTSGPLVNISSTDPVYVTFSLRSADFIKLLNASDKFKDVEVKVQFERGQWYEQVGKINFIDNQIDKNSGSVQMRAVFDNPKGVLVPGDYMKVSLVAPEQVTYMTIPQSCTKGDAMSGYYVWGIEDDKAVRKDIKVSEDIDNNWVVTEGLTLDDKIIVAGIQKILDGIKYFGE
jgi:membrane fusion protein (multidrug efflux system)